MIGERLAKARKAAGMAQVELAVALGGRYDNTMISHVEHGRSSLLLDGAVRAAKELGVSLDYLTGLTDDPTPAAERSGTHAVLTHDSSSSGLQEYSPVATHAIAETRSDAGAEDTAVRPIQVLEVMAAAGSGAQVYDETPVGVLWFRDNWLRYHRIDPAQCHVITVRGDSMDPTLPDGCSILVDRHRRELHDGRIYVMRTEEGLVVKRVKQNAQGWWLLSDNPAWLPSFLNEETDIVGDVRWAARTF